MPPQTFQNLKTERLSLRQITKTDVDDILFLRSDNTVNAFIQRPESRQIKTKEAALAFIQKLDDNLETSQSITWGICMENQANLIGSICLWNFSKDLKRAEIGYDLKPTHHNKGIMNESMKAVLHFGFNELKLNYIEVFTQKNNKTSIALLEKNGFHLRKDRFDTFNKMNLIFELEKLN